MNAIETLLTRNSTAQLQEPAPTIDQISTMVQVALRAADHGWLFPTRFIAIEGDNRAKLGQIFLESTENWQQLPEEKQHKLRNAPLRAPLIIAVVNKTQQHAKIPAQEQLLSSAASAQNLINAAWALGLGAIWRTGDVASNPQVAAKLGLATNEQIIGFIYLGQHNGNPKNLPQHNTNDFLQHWQG